MIKKALIYGFGVAAIAGIALIAVSLRALDKPISTDPAGFKRDVALILAEADKTARQSGVSAGSAMGGAVLAAAIRNSKQQALAVGARPLPEKIYQRLQPCFPSLDLQKVRWKTASGRLTLGSALAGWYLEEGAVALDNVVVFTNTKIANDELLWAHELTHVLQYQELGIDGFSRAYTFGFQEIEQQATENSLEIIERIREFDSVQSSAKKSGQSAKSVSFVCNEEV